MTTLSILIVNWKSKDLVRECLRSIERTHSSAKQIVVVDGGSFDGCGTMLTAEFPAVDFVQCTENLGFGQSNNFGFKSVRGDLVLLLNPDTELCSDALSTLIEALDTLPNAGLVAPRLLNTDRTLQASCIQALPTPANQVLDSAILRRVFPRSRLWGTFPAFSSREPTAVEAVSGACMLMRSELFRRLGGFSPQYFMYGEDMHLCAAIRRLGLSVYHVPTAEVVHHGGGSTVGAFSKLAAVHMRQSVYLFIRENQGKLAAAAYRLLMGLSSVVRLPMLGVAWLLVPRARRKSISHALCKWATIFQWSLSSAPLPPPATASRQSPT